MERRKLGTSLLEVSVVSLGTWGMSGEANAWGPVDDNEAIATIECRVSQTVDLGKSALVIADIVEAKVAAEHFEDGGWTFENGLSLLHHLGGDRFCVSEKMIRGEIPK